MSEQAQSGEGVGVSGTKAAGGRRTYEAPEVTVWGDFEDLTRGVAGRTFESGGPSNTSKNV